MKLMQSYSEICSIQVKEGGTALFWSDTWSEKVLKLKFPRLFSFALDKLQSVAEFMSTPNHLQCFYLPLSIEANDEYIQLQSLLSDVSLNAEVKDVWA